MKVAITTTYWKGSSGGGIKVYLANTVEELKRRGVEVDVIFKEGEDPKNRKIKNGSFPVKLIKALIELQGIKPDVIHSHGGMYYYLIAGLIYKLLRGTRLVYTFHTEPAGSLSSLRRLALQKLLDRCDCVTFVSKVLESRVREGWGLEFKNSAVTYAGVEAKKVSLAEKREFRRRYNIKEDSIILLALGLTALSYKAEGLKILIKALGKVKESYPKIALVATREGKYLDEVKLFAKAQGLDDDVTFTGDVENSYVPIAICDIFTHISLGEGLPIALLEAMSMGKPIIATPVGGIPEAIEDGVSGVLAEPDAEKIAEEILRLIKNRRLAEELGKNAYRVASEKFTWKRSVDKLLEIYTGDVKPIKELTGTSEGRKSPGRAGQKALQIQH